MLSVTLKSDGLVEQGFQHTILRYSHLYKPFRVYDLYPCPVFMYDVSDEIKRSFLHQRPQLKSFMI